MGRPHFSIYVIVEKKTQSDMKSMVSIHSSNENNEEDAGLAIEKTLGIPWEQQ